MRKSGCQEISEQETRVSGYQEKQKIKTFLADVPMS